MHKERFKFMLHICHGLVNLLVLIFFNLIVLNWFNMQQRGCIDILRVSPQMLYV